MSEPAMSRWGLQSDLGATRPGARFDAVVVIPVYNHPATIAGLVHVVLRQELRCILVDDGSEPGCATVLKDLARRHPGAVKLLRLPKNQGKGRAMIAGFHEAHRRGYTHALQIDADGQHDPAQIPQFLALARLQPESLICGCPVYDASVPKIRFYARYATHVLVWINTLSLDIRDSMCGFRVYPLAGTLDVIDRACIGRRMEFETEVAVRLHWHGVSVVNNPTPVTYPADGVSHFRMWRDNLLISRMHALLFLGMLLRLPLLLWRKLRRPRPKLA